MSKKKVAVSKPKPKAQVVKNPMKKAKDTPVEKLEIMTLDQHVNADKEADEAQMDKNTGLLDSVSSVEVNKTKGRKSKEMVVTAEMEKAIEEAKDCIKDGMNKAEVARQAYGRLQGHERKQIVHVFMVGCGLTKAGAGTYCQNCKK